MRRREFIAGLGAAAWPFAAEAQQRATPSIGWLYIYSPEGERPFMPEFDRGLAELGYVVGRNVFIEHRAVAGRADSRPAMIADLVQRRMAVIVTDATLLAQEIKAATQTIPIVFLAGGDPIEFGLVQSLKRPGGNVTGVALMGIEIAAKRLELLRKLVPAAGTIAMMVGIGSSAYTHAETRDVEDAARALGVRMLIVNVGNESEFPGIFATLVEQQIGAVLFSANILFQDARERLIELSAQHKIATLFWDRASVQAGALSSYGHDFKAAFYQAGLYAGRILKGEKPADLPVMQPTKFEFVINLKTAKALGLTVPPTLLALADEVIE